MINAYTYNGEVRKEQIMNNGSKYRMMTNDLPIPIGGLYDIYRNEHTLPSTKQYGGIIEYTYNNEGDYGKLINEQYGRDINNLYMYVTPNIKPSFKTNYYEGFKDYREYISEVYGEKETYLEHLMGGLINVRENAWNLGYDIIPDEDGKTFMDYINDIKQMSDVKYAMEKDRVGIVRDLRVTEALGGVVTTNVNTFDNQDTRLGMLTNKFYAKTLMNGAMFNSMRRTEYITPELVTVYGNNLSNIHNLSSLIRMDLNSSRMNDLDSGEYIHYFTNDLKTYLEEKISDFRLPDEKGVWNYSSATPYFNINKSEDGTWINTVSNSDLSGFEYHDFKGRKNSSNDKSTIHGIIVNDIDEDVLNKNGGDSLLNKTQKLFNDRKIKTLLGGYYDNSEKESSLTQSATTNRFGISHGRNLLTKDAWEKGNTRSMGGYDNPYCRVWTYHNQYSKMSDRIRSFTDERGKFISVNELQKTWTPFRTTDGLTNLSQYGVINKNGMVNITPSLENGVDLKSALKRCMFSIENLAWRKNTATLTEDQKGPYGGRIMWFPPYDIEFQESVNVSWETFEFVGRGEPLFAYKNTKRSGTLTFTLLADSPAILDYWMLDKRNTADDNDEQTLLRFFAGCEPLEVDENKINSIINDYNNGSINLNESDIREKDIIFDVFYPNDYDWDYEETEPDGETTIVNSIDWLMLGGVPTEVHELAEKTLLGYEMGPSPVGIKCTMYEPDEKDGEGENNKWQVKSFISADEYKMVCGDYIEIKNEKTETNADRYECDAKIMWSEFIAKQYDEWNNFEELSEDTDEKEKNIETNRGVINDINKEILALTGYETPKEGENNGYVKPADSKEDDKTLNGANNLGDKHYTNDELYGIWGEDSILGKLKAIIINERTSEEEKKEAKKDFNVSLTLLSNQEKKKKQLDKKNTKYENKIANNNEKTSSVTTKFDIKDIHKQYIKTNPLFFYRKGLESPLFCNTPEIAYREYIKDEKIKKFKNKNKANEEYLTNPDNIGICKIKSDKDDYDYYYVEVCLKNGFEELMGLIVNDEHKFITKSQFMKSNKNIGLVGKKFMVKIEGGTVEGDTLSEIEKHLRLYNNKNDFYNSADEIAKFNGDFDGDNSSKSGYIYKILKKIEGDVKGTVNKMLDELYFYTDEGKKMTEQQIVEKYFKDKIYTKKYQVNQKPYGMVQYFIEMGYEGTLLYNYNGVQELVLDSELELSYSNEKETTANRLAYVQLGMPSYTLVNVLLEYDENGSYYPTKTAATGKNKMDLQSFGLNSTFESVKQKFENGKQTCSFGEFYVATFKTLFDEEIDENEQKMFLYFMLCQENVMKHKLGYTDEQINKAIEDSIGRIEYIHNTLYSNDYSVKKIKINGVEASKNVFENYVKKYDKLSNIEIAFSNVVLESQNGDLSSIEHKKARKVGVQLVVGDYDDVVMSTPDNVEETPVTAPLLLKNYGNEYLFFSVLKEHDNIAYQKLIDKVKYFSPAYHSMTPEGFNDRLTFLHQCTRQGPTHTSSNRGNATNLAFGRPPICILRLGDFLNTQIVINSLSIAYTDNLWDINPEGIGMQPMYAKVQLGIDFLGGSDISGPINRLQNAVSYNYYANTSVYNKGLYSKTAVAQEAEGVIVTAEALNPTN